MPRRKYPAVACLRQPPSPGVIFPRRNTRCDAPGDTMNATIALIEQVDPEASIHNGIMAFAFADA
jgi:hypothetical protein